MTTYNYIAERLRYSDATASASGSVVQQETNLAYRLRVSEYETDYCTATGVSTVETIPITAAEVLSDYPRRSSGAVVSEDTPPEAGMDIMFANGRVYPFTHCGSIAVKQNAKATQEFLLTAVFRSEQFDHTKISQLIGIDVPADIDAYPVIYQSEHRLVDFVLYEDNTPTPLGPKQCKLPTGNLYSQPFIEKVPNETLIVTQYEATMDESTVAERLERVNDGMWLSSGDANQWKITNIEWQDVRVVTGTSQNPLGEDCALVRYTVQRLNKSQGWRSKRALLDTHYLATAGDESTRMPFVTKEGGRTNYIGQIDDNGIPSPSSLEYDTFRVQEEIVFQSFLKNESP